MQEVWADTSSDECSRAFFDDVKLVDNHGKMQDGGGEERWPTNAVDQVAERACNGKWKLKADELCIPIVIGRKSQEKLEC